MQTETATTKGNTKRARRTALAHLFDRRLALVMVLALLLGALAYQTPAQASLNIGWLGDQLFLPTSEGLGQAEADAGRWFGDELTDNAPTGRSRWTRDRALITLSGLAARDETTLVIISQGWPANAQANVAQPTVTVAVNGLPVDNFTPTPDWVEQRVVVPAAALRGSTLEIELRTSDTFGSADDRRQKGLRVAQIRVEPGGATRIALPALVPLAWLILAGMLAYGATSRMFRSAIAVLALSVLVVLVLAAGLALARMWVAALLPWVSLALALLLVATCWHLIGRLLVAIVDRFTGSSALSAGVVVALAGWAGYLLLRAAVLASSGEEFLPLLLLGLTVLLLLWLRPVAAARLVERAVDGLHTRRVAVALLAAFLVAWLGYEAWVVATLPGAGHADYSDNAVVARNLVAGRGWVVDYVTQFYMLYDGLTRPQETWPLLQPVWIAPFFLLFGATDWAAKIPNLIFTAILGVLVYRFGSRLGDRRIGLVAAIVLLTSYLFFVLVINVTSDLGFVVLAFAVVTMVYQWGLSLRAVGGAAQPVGSSFGHSRVLLLGLLTGLMFLQKPGNGVFLATGCGIWLLTQIWQGTDNRQRTTDNGQQTTDNRQRTTDNRQPLLFKRLLPLALWSTIAIAIFTPYLVRNYVLSAQNGHIYGSLVYSTESRDAWVLEYSGDWEDIYEIYTPEYGLSQTQGLPDRSWILRWGFDRTLAKMVHQVVAVRDYLAPPWRGLPLGFSEIVSGPSDGPASFDAGRKETRLLFGAGAWLSFLGLLILLRRRPGLVALLALAFLPYTILLVTYWHANEERYFVALMPWLALMAALALWWLYDRLARVGERRLRPVALLVIIMLAIQMIAPSFPAMQVRLAQWRYADGDRDAYEWLRTSTPADAAVMTRVPWQLNWHSERPALMIPKTSDRTRFFQLARYYGIRYLSLDVGKRPDIQQVQRFLDKLIDDPSNGFTLIYESAEYPKGKTLIYEFPADYGNVPELRP